MNFTFCLLKTLIKLTVFSFLITISVRTIAQVTNQHVYDTIPTMTDHYIKRVAEFQKEPIETGKIIFLGNSITEGGQWRELSGDNSIINRGIGGDVTYGIINRLNDITSRKPAKIFILIGINDIGKDIPDNVIIYNYGKIIDDLKAKSPATKIYVQSLLPVNPQYPKFPQHYDKEYHVIAVNIMLRELATSKGVNFINLYPIFLDAQQRLDKNYTYDGLHLNRAGYQRWFNYLKENKFL